LAKLLPGPLTTYREFPANDEVAIFAEVYDANKGQPHKVDINVTVKAEGGTTVFATREERDSSELAGSAGGYGVTTRFRVDKFEPGSYVLRVEAQSRLGDRPMVARETVFRVVPGAPVAPDASAAAGVESPASSGGTSPKRPEGREAGPGAPAAPAAPGAPVAPPGAPAAPVAPVAPDAPAATGVPMQMTTLAGDQMSAIDSPRQTVVKTAAEFEALWRAHSPGRPVPAVDFSKNMVVAVFLGSRPSSGYEVQITNVSRDGDALLVTWTERRPGRDQMAAQVMTAPAHLVVVPRFEGAVRFAKAPGE
jgi:hypothetical protein